MTVQFQKLDKTETTKSLHTSGMTKTMRFEKRTSDLDDELQSEDKRRFLNSTYRALKQNK